MAGDVSKDDPLSHVRGDFQSAMKSEPGSSCQILHLGNFSTFFQKDFCHVIVNGQLQKRLMLNIVYNFKF